MRTFHLLLAVLGLMILGVSVGHFSQHLYAQPVPVQTADGPVNLAPVVSIAEQVAPGYPWARWATEALLVWTAVINVSKVLVKVLPAPVAAPVQMRFIETDMYAVAHYLVLHCGALASPVASPQPAAPRFNGPPPLASIPYHLPPGNTVMPFPGDTKPQP